jgi:hypothetical protein
MDPLFVLQMIYGYGKPESNSTHSGKATNSGKTSPSASLPTPNPIWTDSGMNPGLRKGEYLLNVKAGGTYISHLALKGQLEVKQQI